MNKRDALAAELREIVREAAEPRRVGDSAKCAINRASHALGITYRRCRSFWYGHTEKVLVTRAEAARLRMEHDRLLTLRLERLRHDIAATERLLEQARRRNATATEGAADLDRGCAGARGEVDYTSLICGCAS